MPRRPFPARGRRRSRPPEEALQRTLLEWLEFRHPDLATLTIHVPNGGARTAAEGGILKALGVRPGIPDLLCFAPRGVYCGAALELKTGSNTPTPEQWYWLRTLAELGWRGGWANDLVSARLFFDQYAAMGVG